AWHAPVWQLGRGNASPAIWALAPVSGNLRARRRRLCAARAVGLAAGDDDSLRHTAISQGPRVSASGGDPGGRYLVNGSVRVGVGQRAVGGGAGRRAAKGRQ